ncbi:MULTISPECIES: hypothetical protein [Niastella]|uniref:DUF3108 domain-containing protein n=1 Tax=Niastella soli TaxID=2821487 RepID=A0ABS3Z1V1_9BACT|nr:hypothetical protein [Niastella soli]MBO9204123.1 hypothetical protein [Niastella soli]
MNKYLLIVVSCLVCFLFALPGFSQDNQDNQWLKGTWNGVYYGEKSMLTKSFDTRLQVTKVNGAQFEGVVQAILPTDTTVRLHTRIVGRIYENHLMTKLKEVVYFKDPPGQYSWAKNCNLCDSMKYTIEKRGDSVVLEGERKCDTLCSIVARYTKNIGALEAEPAYLYQPDISLRQFTIKIATSFSFVKPVYKDSLAGRDHLAGRAVEKPIRYDINSDSAEIWFMDNGIVDGDTISVYYNGQLIVPSLCLKVKPFAIKVPVYPGYPNLLVVYAESLGSLPPNTAYVRILYGKKEQSFLLSSTMSKSGSIELINNSAPK